MAAPAEPPARRPHLPAILQWTWARRRSGRAQGGAAGASCRRVSSETPPGEGAAAAGGRVAPSAPEGHNSERGARAGTPAAVQDGGASAQPEEERGVRVTGAGGGRPPRGRR